MVLDEIRFLRLASFGFIEPGSLIDSRKLINDDVRKQGVKERASTLVNKAQRNQRRAAGKKSAVARAARAAKRLPFVKRAWKELTPLDQMNPNSAVSMRLLKEAYTSQLIKAGFDLEALVGPPFKVRDETLRSDLKRLGIRSSLRSQ
jgi:hypothetical protein